MPRTVLFLAILAVLITSCSDGDGEQPPPGQQYCADVPNPPWTGLKTFPLADAVWCSQDNHEGCNPCAAGSVCSDGVVSGVASKGTASPMYLDPAQNWICTRTCQSDADCAGMSFATANARKATETWTCSTVADRKLCAVVCAAVSTDTCGEPCPSKCCSPSGLTCCKPPFCGGSCSGSPCC